MAGRKKYWTEERKKKALEIIFQRIREGESTLAIMGKDRDKELLPGLTIFHEWMSNGGPFTDEYARAMAERHNVIFEEILKIADKKGDHHDRRLQIDARKWVLGRMNPAKYGDRIQTESKVEITNSDLTDEELDAKIAELEKKNKK